MVPVFVEWPNNPVHVARALACRQRQQGMYVCVSVSVSVCLCVTQTEGEVSDTFLSLFFLTHIHTHTHSPARRLTKHGNILVSRKLSDNLLVLKNGFEQLSVHRVEPLQKENTHAHEYHSVITGLHKYARFAAAELYAHTHRGTRVPVNHRQNR